VDYHSSRPANGFLNRPFITGTPAKFFREHAALSGFENNAEQGLRDFDISAFAKISQHEYDLLQPIQWPVNRTYPHGRARLFDDGQFFTASGKAQFIAIEPRPPVNLPDKNYPLILNTGRLRDQWHTMTRTAIAAKLNQHKPEPFVEMHSVDAQSYALLPNALAVIESQWGSMIARYKLPTASNRVACLCQCTGPNNMPARDDGRLSQSGR